VRETKRLKSRRGITLLEILVAAAILAVGLLGALEAIARSTAATRQADERTRALMSARSKMEEILKEPVLQVGQDQGQGVDETTDYDWFATIEPTQNPALVQVRIRAQHRVTGNFAEVTAIRRPDLDTAPDGTTIDPTAEAAAAAEAASGAGGAPL
jgi:general secretion pathway protein I